MRRLAGALSLPSPAPDRDGARWTGRDLRTHGGRARAGEAEVAGGERGEAGRAGGGARGVGHGTERRRALELLATAQMTFLLLPPCVGDRIRPGGLHPLFTRGKLVLTLVNAPRLLKSVSGLGHAEFLCVSDVIECPLSIEPFLEK